MLIGDRGFLIDLIHCEIDKHHHKRTIVPKTFCLPQIVETLSVYLVHLRWIVSVWKGKMALNNSSWRCNFQHFFFRVNHKYSKLSENSLQTYFFYFHRKTQTITETASILSDLFAFPSKKNNFMADLFFEKYLFFDLETLEIN